MSTTRHIRIFDTTLRDGEQAPGASMNRAEKLEVARQLAKLRVDVIEAGFPVASPDDFDAVQAIAGEVEGARVCGLARAIEKDIRVCWDAVRQAEAPRIHTFISTSAVHMKYQIRKTPDEVKADTRAMVALAVELAGQRSEADVEFSAMDASRSEPEFLAEVLGIAVEAGATTINIPDTVGYAQPLEFGDFIRRALSPLSGAARRHRELSLPRRPRSRGRELARRRARRRDPGRVRRERHRRARRQRLARRGRHGDPHPRRLLRRRDRCED